MTEAIEATAPLADLSELKATLPGPAQKVLDPASPPALRQMALRGIVPGLKPGDALAILVLLATATDASTRDAAHATLAKLPAPLLNGALAGSLHPLVLFTIAPLYAQDAAIAERIVAHADITAEAVIAMARRASEAVCELIATNEERLLENPSLIEALYKNRATRMSTADRIVELAIRNGVDVPQIAAFKEIAAAISDQLIPEASSEPTYDDLAFSSLKAVEEGLEDAIPDASDPQDDAAARKLAAKAKRIEEAEKRFEDLSTSGKIRAVLTTAKATVRLKGLRDPSPLVRKAAVKSDSFTDAEAESVASQKNTYEDVLREIGNAPTLTRRHKVKVNLISNPRTPVGIAQKFLPFMREYELKQIAASKDVQGAVAEQARQMLKRKGK